MKSDLYSYAKRPICISKETCQICLRHVLGGPSNASALARPPFLTSAKTDVQIFEKRPIFI